MILSRIFDGSVTNVRAIVQETLLCSIIILRRRILQRNCKLNASCCVLGDAQESSTQDLHSSMGLATGHIFSGSGRGSLPRSISCQCRNVLNMCNTSGFASKNCFSVCR